MKVAVTGASGHVGACLCRELINGGIEVKALLHNDDRGVCGLNIEFIKGDLLDKNILDSLCRDVDAVFHLAGKISIENSEKEEVFRTNVDGTRLLLNSCIEKGVSRFIHFSSIHALSAEPLNEKMDECRPLINSEGTFYEITKAESERLVLKAAESGLNAVILNPTAIIGPCDYKPSYLGQALIKIALNKLPMLVSGGYDWVDVRDVADAAIQALTKGKKGERYILSGNWYSLKELSEMIGKVSGNKTPKFVCPTAIAKIGLPVIKLYAKLKNEHPLYTSESLDILSSSNRNISNNKAKEKLGFTIRSLEDTITDTLSWYTKNNLL
ncbi:MAG: hypothetical protein B6D61_08285 [Bacteroidetes bacterium 4484_249]|nr:MAG: hypothetical protein B6D61_08285 [Bacteroidetes bacterium 4484_249]